MAKPGRPAEERDLSAWFMVSSLALVVVLALVVYDETVTRRPWKKYQRDFNALEISLIDAALAEEKERLQSESVKSRLDKIDADLAEARSHLSGEEYGQAKRDFHHESLLADKVQQSLIFMRSERDEAFYQWKKSFREGRESPEAKKRYQSLDEEVMIDEEKLAAQKEKRDEAEARLAKFTDAVYKLESERAKITAHRDGLVRRRAAVLDRRVEIRQLVIPDLGVVDRCPTCHAAINRKGFDAPEIKNPFRSHPELADILGKNHPPERFGCVVCHQGQGPQTKGVGRRPFNHGRNDPYWVRPMLERPYAETSCVKCHRNEWEIKCAPTLTRGKRLFANLACYGCHLTSGFPKTKRIGPSLNGVMDKASPGWIAAWLGDPRGIRPRTRMPNSWPPLEGGADPAAGAARDDEIKAVTAFILTLPGSEKIKEASPAADAETGKRSFIEKGCAGCHRLEAVDLPPVDDPDMYEDYGPELTKFGSKGYAAWIEAYLVNPRAFYPETRMPTVTLTGEERADLASLVASDGADDPYPAPDGLDEGGLLEKGERLVGIFGCFGCHEMKGFENSPRVAPELNGFGDKGPEMLSFGDTILDHQKQTWLNWTRLKIASPRAFANEREVLVMPDPELEKEDVEAAAVYLMSFRNDPVPAAYPRRLDKIQRGKETGERLIREYNCLGCHLQDGKGGHVRRVIGDPGLRPPELTGEGAKVQPEWLFQFLKKPDVLRPWMTMRMPDFSLTDDEALAFTQYFTALAGKDDVFVQVPKQMTPEMTAGTARAFATLKCLQCHQLTAGPDVKLSDLAPDMALTRDRLRPSWIKDFIADPQYLMPETKMPTFFPLEDDDDPDSLMTPLADWLGGDAWAQVEAIKDYLYLLKSSETVAVMDRQTAGPD